MSLGDRNPQSATSQNAVRAVASMSALLAISACVVYGCVGASTTSAPRSSRSSVNPTVQPKNNTPPTFLLGNFDDDYGGSFVISSTEFVQLPRGRFHIVEWNIAQQYFIAQNDSLNRSDPSKWTRIDWLPLTGMQPYTWAFCFSAYRANTRAEAELAAAAKRDAPRVGCAGFPFTRMKPRS